MHMADALLSPVVGATMWAVSAGSLAYCSKKVHRELDDRNVPLMGVLAAFLFAAQTINFTIPGTGSSGHLGGGLLLTLLLGPHAAFLAIASVLIVQCLFFADGGILALGCNIFNMGFIPSFIVYPFIFRNLRGKKFTQVRLTTAIILSALVGLQLGPLGVVLETWFSGISALPFATFLLLMQPIHLAIGVVEGIVTVAVVGFVHQARPEILRIVTEAPPPGRYPLRGIVVTFFIAALLVGGGLSLFASRNPDGLEWAIARVTGSSELKAPERGIHGILAVLQGRTAVMPDYSFRKPAGSVAAGSKPGADRKMEEVEMLGTATAGLAGTLLTMALVFGGGFILKRRCQPADLPS